MKRKVIQLAEKTFVVSLPTKWVREWDVKKGDELELEHTGSTITINTQKSRAIKKCTLDLANINERTLRWLLSSLHKKGYDELELTNTKKHQNTIDELIQNLLLGFAVVHSNKNRTVIRSVSSDNASELDTMLRRAFLVTLQLGEELLSALESDNKEHSTQLLKYEKINNRLTNFCERIINKHEKPPKTTFLYIIVWNLEKIADDYKYITNSFFEKNATVQPETIELLKDANKVVRIYYELFYKFDQGKLSATAEELKKLKQKIAIQMQNTKDPQILSHIQHLVLKTADFSASMYAIHN